MRLLTFLATALVPLLAAALPAHPGARNTDVITLGADTAAAGDTPYQVTLGNDDGNFVAIQFPAMCVSQNQLPPEYRGKIKSFSVDSNSACTLFIDDSCQNWKDGLHISHGSPSDLATYGWRDKVESWSCD